MRCHYRIGAPSFIEVVKVVATMADRVKNEILVTTPPVNINGAEVHTITVTPMSFPAFCAAFAAAQNNDPADVKKQLTREKVKRSAHFKTESGTEIPFAVSDFLQLPIPYARELIALIDRDSAPFGTVVSPEEHDGITAPILFKLGTPIKTDKGEISELEFLAKTFGDIEDVMSAENQITQTLSLIQTVAAPLGSDVQLLQLPTWAIDGITVEDGFAIMRLVLPAFLG